MIATVLRAIIAAVIVFLGPSCAAVAQEMEPRAYSALPVGTNFLALGYGHSSGDVLLDPSLPLSDVRASIDSVLPGYSHTFDMAGRMVSAAAVLPYVRGDVKGMVGNEPGEAQREGPGDARFRLSTNLIGGTALTPEEFSAQTPSTTLGTSLSIIAPTGEYTSRRLINIGSNRWALKPELGCSKIIGNWFAEASTGVWLFTDNHNFYGGVLRTQEPLSTFQLHGGYTFLPGLWLAANATYYTGGRTTISGVEKNDLQTNSRYGLTLSLPFSKSMSLKLAFSKGLTTRIGGDFTTLAAVLQYRWFSG